MGYLILAIVLFALSDGDEASPRLTVRRGGAGKDWKWVSVSRADGRTAFFTIRTAEDGDRNSTTWARSECWTTAAEATRRIIELQTQSWATYAVSGADPDSAGAGIDCGLLIGGRLYIEAQKMAGARE